MEIRKILISIKGKSFLVKVAGVLLIAIGAAVTYLGGEISSDADKGLMVLDKMQLDRGHLP